MFVLAANTSGRIGGHAFSSRKRNDHKPLKKVDKATIIPNVPTIFVTIPTTPPSHHLLVRPYTPLPLWNAWFVVIMAGLYVLMEKKAEVLFYTIICTLLVVRVFFLTT